MKRFLTMIFAFTLSSSTGVLGATNTCNNTITVCQPIAQVICITSSTNTNCNTNTNWNTNTYCDTNTNWNINTDCNTNNDCDTNTDCNTNNDCDTNTDCDTNADCNTNTEVNTPSIDIEVNDNTNIETNTPSVDTEINDNTNIETNAPSVDTEINDNTNTENTTPEIDNSILSIEKEVVELVNQERAKYGLSPLEIDTELSSVARLKSQDMANLNYFSHTSPTYGSPFDMMKQFNIQYRTAGENIAKGQQTAEAVVNAWMNSEGHRANILNSSYTHIGVGYVSSGNTTYWTQMFISK